MRDRRRGALPDHGAAGQRRSCCCRRAGCTRARGRRLGSGAGRRESHDSHRGDHEGRDCVIEAVVGPSSLLIGQRPVACSFPTAQSPTCLPSPQRPALHGTVTRHRAAQRRRTSSSLQGSARPIADATARAWLLPLAARQLRLGSVRRGLIPIAAWPQQWCWPHGHVVVGVSFFGAAAADYPARLAVVARSLREGRVAILACSAR